MRRISNFQKLVAFYVTCWVLVIGAWIWNGITIVQAIEKRPKTCSEELEDVQTQLRLRTGELRVARGQLDSALKKLKKCGVSMESATEE